MQLFRTAKDGRESLINNTEKMFKTRNSDHNILRTATCKEYTNGFNSEVLEMSIRLFNK